MDLLDLDKFEPKCEEGITKKVWWMNIGCEKIWNQGQTLLPHMTNKYEKETIAGTEQLCLLLAKKKDIVILQQRPEELLCDHLTSIGFTLPEIIIPKDTNQLDISQAILNDAYVMRYLKEAGSKSSLGLMPYCITKYEEDIAEAVNGKLYGTNSKIISWVNNKCTARQISQLAGLNMTEGYICNNIEEVLTAYNKLINGQIINKLVIKEPYGASGKGLLVVNNEREFKFFLRILKGKKINNFELIIEKWYDTILDINYQIFIKSDGTSYYIEPKNQIVNNSIYVGCDGLGKNNQLTGKQRTYFQTVAETVANVLYKQGYWGMASIDAIITKERGIIPILEINGRFSLSTYISFIPQRLGIKAEVYSRYYNIKSNVNIQKIFLLFHDVLYVTGKDKGIIIYSYSEGININGRLFTLIIGDDINKNNLLKIISSRLKVFLA